jgi:hypothetical protein
MDTRARLIEAREKLDSKDLAGAMAIYEDVLAKEGGGGETLATISGDLGATGHIPELIEVLAPLYEPGTHGPAAGLNLLQAFLAVGDPDSARHVMDLLAGLNLPELQGRLSGFEVAIGEMNEERVGNYAAPRTPMVRGSLEPPAAVARANAVSISKPIWFYGLEALAEEILPAKEGRLRRIAFTQLSIEGVYDDLAVAARAPEDESARLARAFPLWFAEAFYFSPLYSPIAAMTVIKEAHGASLPLLLDHDWTADNLRQLVDTTKEVLDYAITGRLTRTPGESRLDLRVWDVRKFRERKQFTAGWKAGAAGEALESLRKDVCRFMECVPGSALGGIPYAPQPPDVWLDVLASSVGLFFAGKGIFPMKLLAPLGPTFAALEPRAGDSAMASLAWMTLAARARALGLDPDIGEPILCADSVVARAKGSGC